MCGKIVAFNLQRLASCMLILSVLCGPTKSAIVAQEKLKEMAQEAIGAYSLSNEDDLRLIESTTKETSSADVVQPLSLQIAVLQVTDALSHEVNLPKWQAMLRALGGDREILKRFAQLRPHFTILEKQLGQGQEWGIEEQLEKLASLETSSSWSRIWAQLHTLVHNVANLYDWFDRYQRNAAVVNERTLRDYAETVHGAEGLTISKTLDSIHKTICPFSTIDGGMEKFNNRSDICSNGALEMLQMALTEANENFICSMSRSTHQLVYDFYALLSLTNAKGYAMMQFSWMLLRLYGKGTSRNYATEAEEARADFSKRIKEMTEASRKALIAIPTWIWKCDTIMSNQKENETYIKFSELLQGYVVNEVDLNQDNSCKESCSAYSNSQEKGCFGNQLCAHTRRCSGGRIYNCGFIEADSNICTSSMPGRRYDWIEYKSGRIFGPKSECNEPKNKNLKVDSWWRWIFWHCSYCMCLCDQPGLNSDRYVSLQTALAAVSSNRLITGVRFVKTNRIVHIQIQDGVALPRGLVNESSLVWQSITPVEILKDDEKSMEDGLGYATLRYEERALDLDDLQAPKGHVITGLRFRKLGGHLNLEAQASPIDFTTGIIDTERTVWISNDNTPAAEIKPRTKLFLFSPDVSIRSRVPSLPDSTSDQFIEFQASSLEKDVSQNTVPFIDATQVSAQPPSWLSGIGIYHKGQPGYGGFIAFRIATLNFTDHMTTFSNELNNFSEEDTVS